MSIPDFERDKQPEDEFTPEDRLAVDGLIAEYRSHTRRQSAPMWGPPNGEKPRAVNEIANEHRAALEWLLIDNSEEVDEITERTLSKYKDFYLDYSTEDVEDLFFIVYEQLPSGRAVSYKDILEEPQETEVANWRSKTNKAAAEYLIIHGADENEVNAWKKEGHDRQQRAMRRMYWLLNEPYVAQFATFLENRASREKPLKFSELAIALSAILREQLETHMERDQESEDWIPRKQDEFDATTRWIKRALNVCEHVFSNDIRDDIYVTPGGSTEPKAV